MNPSFSGKKKDSLGVSIVRVWVARMMVEVELPVLSSAMRPEGMSMEMTWASEVLMYFTRAANPPERGRLRPMPKSPSMTRLSRSSLGGVKLLRTMVR